MRKPAPFNVLFAWWRSAVKGENPARHDGIPECGFYKVQKVKDGPFQAVRIFVVRELCPQTGELMDDEEYVIKISGIEDEKGPEYFWMFLKPISRSEYNRLLEKQVHDPRYGDANRPVNLSEQPTYPENQRIYR